MWNLNNEIYIPIKLVKLLSCFLGKRLTNLKGSSRSKMLNILGLWSQSFLIMIGNILGEYMDIPTT